MKKLLDFTKHGELFQQIKDSAEENERSVHAQIIYLLKKAMKPK